MKTIFLTTVALFLAFTLANAENLNKQNAETSFGEYQVSSQETPTVTKGENNTYIIHYERFDNPITVTVIEGETCKSFLVKTEGFEVQYDCTGSTFGVNYMNAEFASIPKKEMVKKVNRENYLKQRVISTNKHSEYDTVRLIACYLPELMS